MRSIIRSAFCVKAIIFSAATIAMSEAIAQAQSPMPTALVGYPGNPASSTSFGAVGYEYRIGQCEVTNAQYAAFLNAVAATDTYGLYNTAMSGTYGGIVRSGSAGAYTYATIAGRENRPVVYVSFWDACRFANWMHKGQPTGAQGPSTTEGGAYTLTPAGIAANNVQRNAGWSWAVTSENEWFKAAYYQPASAGGPSGHYWVYPTSTWSIHTGLANYGGVIGHATDVGTYGANFCGTYDMAGNVWEWNESIIEVSKRGLRSGSFDLGDNMRIEYRYFGDPRAENLNLGFRLSARFVPCPADFDRSGFVDSDDFVMYVTHFALGCVGPGQGAFGAEPACLASADFDGSGFVDSDDFVAYIDAFETPCEN
jgi:formylglycine-generating enzyme required for sulfatase activity